MQKTKTYRMTIFAADTLKKAITTFLEVMHKPTGDFSWSISTKSEQWEFDDESEFYADYHREFTEATISEYSKGSKIRISCDFLPKRYDVGTRVLVMAKTRSEIELVFNIFEDAYDSARLETESRIPKPEPVIFIGHGQSNAWKEVKDHLHEKHGYRVEAYEIGARAGMTIQEILEEMLESSSFAILVLTGEDETADKTHNPRLNVVHEAGLCQGQLGFRRAIILLETGTQEFSNIAGLQQIRFEKDGISSTYGELLATLKREFE